jgi:hypothetical protein
MEIIAKSSNLTIGVADMTDYLILCASQNTSSKYSIEIVKNESDWKMVFLKTLCMCATFKGTGHAADYLLCKHDNIVSILLKLSRTNLIGG